MAKPCPRGMTLCGPPVAFGGFHRACNQGSKMNSNTYRRRASARDKATKTPNSKFFIPNSPVYRQRSVVCSSAAPNTPRPRNPGATPLDRGELSVLISRFISIRGFGGIGRKAGVSIMTDVEDFSPRFLLSLNQHLRFPQYFFGSFFGNKKMNSNTYRRRASARDKISPFLINDLL